MKKHHFFFSLFIFLIAASLIMVPGFTVHAGSNNTSAVQFGFGAQINPHTDNIDLVVRNASQIGFNWLAVEFNWALQWPDPSQPVNLNTLNQAATASRPYQANLMVTIKNPPAWALTPQGPNADYVTALVATIMQSFPDVVGAIELFPGANQVSQWGVPADPAQFALILNEAQNSIALSNPRAVVIASITPLGDNRQEGDLEDLAFLSALYQAGVNQRFPVIGVNFTAINGDPTQDPLTDSAHNLRHYEDIRKVMRENGRSSDLIWVTSFSWPSSLTNNQEQAEWLFNAYKLLRTQLYIGAAFFKNLNSNDPTNAGAYLISQNIITHPAGVLLQQLMNSNQVGSYDGKGSSQTGDSLTNPFALLWEKLLTWLGLR